MKQQSLFSPRNMAMTALFTALTCVLAPWSLPIGPVPISLTTLVLFLSLYVLGAQKAALSYLLYLLLGLAGLPVFSGFTGGIAKLAGPTGGYILGFLPMLFITGWFLKKFEGKFWASLAGMVLGTAVCYAFGTVWFVFLMGTDLLSALAVCVFPFLPGDLVKMLFAHALGTALRRRLGEARLLQG